MNYSFSVVVPVYNLESEILIFDGNLRSNLKDYCFKLIYVNDGSTDGSLEKLNVIKDKNTFLINNNENKGQHLSIYEGLKYVEGDFVIIMDGDNQANPNVVPKLILKNKDDSSKIIHVLYKENISKYQNFISNSFYIFLYIFFNIRKEEVAHTFKLIPISIVNKIIASKKTYPSINAHLLVLSKNLNFKNDFIFSKREKRIGVKKTSYSTIKILNLLIKNLIFCIQFYPNRLIYLILIMVFYLIIKLL